MMVRGLLKGGASMSLAAIVRVALQVLVLPLLARILAPHDYGLVSLAMPVIVFSMAIGDGGIGAPLMRRTGEGDDVWSTAFWLVTGIGAALALLTVALAPAISLLFGEPALTPIVMVLALTLVMQGLSTIPATRLQKAQRFHLLASVEILATLTGVAVLFALAFRGAGAWSLVAQQLAYWFVRTAGVFLVARWRPAFLFRLPLIADDMRFGWSMLKVAMVNFSTRSLDVFFLGIFHDAAHIGYYAIAMQVIRLPANVIIGPLSGVLLSHLVKFKDSPAGVGRMLIATTAGIASLVVPSTFTAAAASHEIFAFVFSAKWAPSALIYTLMAPGAAIQAIVYLVMPCLVALGQPAKQLRYATGLALLWSALVLVGSVWGSLGVALAIDAAFLIYAPIVIASVRHTIDFALRDYVAAIARSLVGAAIGIAGYAAVAATLHPVGLAAVCIAVAFALLGVAVALLLNRRLLSASGLATSAPLPVTPAERKSWA